MQCPQCKSMESSVLDSRLAEENTSIRRRRLCTSCQGRFTTYERIKDETWIVIKKDGREQILDAEKITAGLAKALEKRPVNQKIISHAVEQVMKTIKTQTTTKVSSDYIGSLVMEHLQMLDKVAYVRFVSVHRQFESVEQFLQEIKQILN